MEFLTKVFGSKATKTFNATLKLAEQLHTDLAWVPGTKNGMDMIVKFFTITSECQDAFNLLMEGHPSFECKNEKQTKFFTDFQKLLNNAGRCEYGWNRTVVDETPTPATVFVNMKTPYDEKFVTRSVADHLSRRNNPAGEIDHALKEESWGKWNETGLVEKEFVNPFMQKNYDALTKMLADFKK